MTTTSIEEVIAQNNATVAFLQCQDFPSALRSSIVAMKCNRMVDSWEHTGQSSSQSASDSVGSLDRYHSGIGPDSYDSSCNQFMYTQGILIPVGKEHDRFVITAILVFNVALCHHLMAMALRSDGHYQRAQQLYELAYKAYNMDENLLFQFIVINNIAVIQSSTGNGEASKECFDYLTSLYYMLVLNHQDSNLQILHHIRGFVANIPTEIIASAAA